MYCKKCGKEVADGTKFCPYCGTGLDETKSSPKKSGGTKSKKGIIAGVVVIAAAVAVVGFVKSRPKKINLEEVVSVSCEGYNGLADPELEVDFEKLDAAICDALGYEDDNPATSEMDLESRARLSEGYLACLSAIDATLDKTENVSNGDVITVSFEIDNESVKQYKVKFTGESVKYTVEGLKDLEKIDPFEGLQVTFEGTAPNGKAKITYEGGLDIINESRFESEKRSGLKNGDVVTMNFSMPEDYLAENGYIAVKKTQDYVVEGLDEYVTTFANIPDDFFEHAKQEAKDKVESYGRNAGSSVGIKDVSYSGYVFTSSNDKFDSHSSAITFGNNNSNSFSDINKLYVVYKGMFYSKNDKFEDTEIYYPVAFDNILKTQDGVTSKEGYICTSDPSPYIAHGPMSIKGCSDAEIAFEYMAIRLADKFDAEAGDGFEKYLNYIKPTKLADISDGKMAEFADAAKRSIESYVEKHYTDSSELKDLTLLGEYLLVQEEGEWARHNNVLYVIYKGNVVNEDFGSVEVIFPVKLADVVAFPDGGIFYLNYGIQGSTKIPDSRYSTKGYLKCSTFFDNELRYDDGNHYTIEPSEGMEEYMK